jgi:hypothetical protein
VDQIGLMVVEEEQIYSRQREQCVQSYRTVCAFREIKIVWTS